MKRIILLATGGTIASTADEGGRSMAGALAGEALVSQIQLREGMELHVSSVFQKPSNAITLHDLYHLRDQCQALIDGKEVDGIVITHGTDTLEDTAFFLDCTLDTGDIPVVVTGSQRVPHAMGTDAFVNLQNAIYVAAAPQAKGMGVLVSFNEMIYCAAFVQKVSSYQVNGFDAPARGCLGIIDNGSVTIYQRPHRLPVITPAPAVPDRPRELPIVDIASVHLDARSQLLDAAVDSGARAVVIDALGRGHVPPGWMPSIRRAIAADVIIAIGSSTLHGPVHQAYAFQGSLHDLENAGAIGISGLTARKIRMRLIALLEAHDQATPEMIRSAFSTR